MQLNFSRTSLYFVWILSLQKNTLHCPKEKVTLIQEGYVMFVLNTAFVGRHGDVVIIFEVTWHILQKLCFVKGTL